MIGTPEYKAGTYAERVAPACERWLPIPEAAPERLHEAMRYAVLSGGKHLRPMLIYAAGEALGVPPNRLDGPAAAVEMVHAYSLIHDDLPAMDDDDLRRGKPTCHKQFDEATAILAGDALQTLAFEVLACDPSMDCEAQARVNMMALLARACGSRGMAGGQAMDLAAVGTQLSPTELEAMHRHKTGRLIHVCLLLACEAGEASPEQRQALDLFGLHTGLAFQIHDDILDEEGSTESIGKQAGADRALGKPTYPSVLGLDASKAKADELTQAAIDALKPLGDAAETLRYLAQFVIARQH